LKKHLKYIFSFFLVLSLLGLGENVIITCSNVKNNKETEWVTKANPNVKVTKCYHYHQSFNSNVTIQNLHSWSNAFTIFYNRIISVKFLSQSKIFGIIPLIGLISNKLYIPRISIEYHHIISSNRTDLSSPCSLLYESRHAENIMLNYLLGTKWINKQIRSIVISMELNALQNGFGTGYI
jgi:hypothetical protein